MRQAARSISVHKSTRSSGMGVLYDNTTGAMSFSTGSKILPSTYGSLPHSSDPNLTFPFPNERDYRVDKIQGVRLTSNTSQTNRRIGIRKVGGPINMASMPIQPPRLQWRGRNCITARQLEEIKQLRKSQNSYK